MIPEEVCRLLELTTEAAFVTDANGEIIQANAALSRKMGVAPTALAGQCLTALTTTAADKVATALRFCLRSCLPVVGAFEFQTASGEALRFAYRALVVRRSDNRRSTLLAFQREQSTAFRVLDDQVKRLSHEVRIRQQREQELAESIDLFHSVMDSLDALVYVADMESYEILFINDFGRKTFGDVQGKICWQVLQHGQQGPCDFCTNDRLIDAQGEPTGVYQWEFQNTQDGEWYDCRDRAIRWSDGRLVRMEIATNISERKRAEEVLMAAHQKLQDIIEFLPDATFAIDRDKKVIAWNLAMEEMTGVVKERMLGGSDYAAPFYGHGRSLLIDQLLEPDLQLEAQYDYVKQKGNCLVGEVFIPTLRDGQGAYLWVIATPLLDSHGNKVGAIESLRDISELKQAEAELKLANRELDAFVYTVSHDLRTPLTPIIGYADYIREGYGDHLNERVLEGLDEISTAGNRMLALMEDLLALARVRDVERPGQPVELANIVRTSLHGLADQLEHVGARVVLDELPPCRVPETLLVELFDNLIGNALRYGCQKGDVIEIGGERGDEKVRFYVRDHGPGVSPLERQRILRCFSVANRARNIREPVSAWPQCRKLPSSMADRAGWRKPSAGAAPSGWNLSINSGTVECLFGESPDDHR